MEIEYKKVKVRKNSNVKFDWERGEIRLCGTRIALINMLPACERIDKMFGTGGEVIVNCMAFEPGRQLFEAMVKDNPNKNKEELLREMVDALPQTGWGITNLKIINNAPPKIEVAVENSPVKTLQGSSKHLIGSFWAGVLSKYFSKQLKCVNFSYDENGDTLYCMITS
ncbi:MAG: hypothetical protein PVF15_08055 [Candidatus Bathyarchaeota archaeon]|jgi:hypothetical protein